MLGEPEIEPALHHFQCGARELLIGDHPRLRLQNVIARRNLADGLAKPAQRAVMGEHERLIDGVVDSLRPALNLAGQRFLRRRVQGLLGFALHRRVWREPESMQHANMLPFDEHVASIGDFRFKHCVLSQSTHQDAGSAVDKPVGQPFVQRVGQIVLYLTRDALPMLWIAQPVWSVGYIVESAHLRYARRQGVYIPVGPVKSR